jgi:hypothetical protein
MQGSRARRPCGPGVSRRGARHPSCPVGYGLNFRDADPPAKAKCGSRSAIARPLCLFGHTVQTGWAKPTLPPSSARCVAFSARKPASRSGSTPTGSATSSAGGWQRPGLHRPRDHVDQRPYVAGRDRAVHEGCESALPHGGRDPAHCRPRGGEKVNLDGRRGYGLRHAVLDNLIATIPPTIISAARIRVAVTASPSTATPRTKAPTAPMPVQTV